MKTERRHELQHNALADWLGQQIESVRPYARGIVGLLLLVAALLVAFNLMRGNRERRQAQSWSEYLAATSTGDPQALRDVAARFPRTEAAAWSMQAAANSSLIRGCDALFRDRAEALELLKAAKDDFEAAYETAGSDMLKQRALMGLAQSCEALNDLETAEATYQRVLEAWPESALGKTAQERLAFLQKPSTRAFSEWFASQEIKPPSRAAGGGGLPTPSAYDDLPSNPDLALPDATDLERAGAFRGGLEEALLDDGPVADPPLEAPRASVQEAPEK